LRWFDLLCTIISWVLYDGILAFRKQEPFPAFFIVLALLIGVDRFRVGGKEAVTLPTFAKVWKAFRQIKEYHKIDSFFPLYIFVGFIAQIIDGALGMAYGVSANAFLLSIGIPPAPASASVRVTEMVTTAISGASHWRVGNIDWKLVKRLLIPGVVGGLVGAYLLTSIDGNVIKPFIALYLLILGSVILVRAFTEGKGVKGYFITRLKAFVQREHTIFVSLLGSIGGFLDAIGGGGWGPVVTTTLVARGRNPRMTIGSVILSEFFVALASAITFALALNFSQYWQVILGLLIGGAIAAPFGARVTKALPPKTLMIMVGMLIIILSLSIIYLAWI
jgi:uncharacterized protein